MIIPQILYYLDWRLKFFFSKYEIKKDRRPGIYTLHLGDIVKNEERFGIVAVDGGCQDVPCSGSIAKPNVSEIRRGRIARRARSVDGPASTPEAPQECLLRGVVTGDVQ